MQLPPSDATREQLLDFCKTHQIKHHWRNGIPKLRGFISEWARFQDPNMNPLERFDARLAHRALKRVGHDRPGAARILRKYLGHIEPLAVIGLEAQNNGETKRRTTD